MKAIRPQLDEVQKSLMTDVDTIAVRPSKTCHADVAKAVGSMYPSMRISVAR
jgi:hypothetical protein